MSETHTLRAHGGDRAANLDSIAALLDEGYQSLVDPPNDTIRRGLRCAEQLRIIADEMRQLHTAPLSNKEILAILWGLDELDAIGDLNEKCEETETPRTDAPNRRNIAEAKAKIETLARRSREAQPPVDD